MDYEEQEKQIREIESAEDTLSQLMGFKANQHIKALEMNNQTLADKLAEELAIMAQENKRLNDPKVREKIKTVYLPEVQRIIKEKTQNMKEREKVDFLGEIEEPDYTLKITEIDFSDPIQSEAFEQQEKRNRKIYLQKELRSQYEKGIIDKDGKSFVTLNHISKLNHTQEFKNKFKIDR